MKKFRFNLQTALDVRGQRVDELKAQFGQLQTERLKLMNHRQQLIDQLNDAACQRNARHPLGIQMAEQWPVIQERMGHAINEMRQQEAQLDQQITALQQQLYQAVLDHKVLETLKAKQKMAHERAVIAEEEAGLADLVQARYGRNLL